MENVKEWGVRIKSAVESAFFGKGSAIDLLLVSILSEGHVLLEDIPGLGKTILARALAAAMGGTWKRIQGTPDLMPADILGNVVFKKQEKKFHYHPGPLFANVILFDEINRAAPRTQSALLEAMDTRKIIIEGKPKHLPDPFILIATENPIEYEGTFPLPEAQKDRFFLTASLGYPDRETEKRIIESQSHDTIHPVEHIKAVSTPDEIITLRKTVQSVVVSTDLEELILNVITSLRQKTDLLLAPSPRATRALYRGTQASAALRGKSEATREDLFPLLIPVLEKRLLLSPEAELRKVTVPSILEEVVRLHEG